MSTGVIRVRRGVSRVDGKYAIGTPKSDAGIRDVAVPPHLHPVLAVHLRANTPSGREALLSPSATGAVLAAQTGATLAERMGRLGHSTPQAALRYRYVAGGRDCEIAVALSRMAGAEHNR